MTFRSEEETYDIYNVYVKRIGFSIRKSHIDHWKDGSLVSKRYICSKEGQCATHPTHVTKESRAIERTNCMACSEFKIDQENIWTIKKVELNHNHVMTSLNKA